MYFEFFLFIIALISFYLFALRRLLRYLRFFQQEEYDWLRYLKWVVANKAIDRRATLAIFITSILAFTTANHKLCYLCFATLFFCIYWFEPNPLTTGKIKLNLTTRAKRIYGVALLALVIIILVLLSIALEPNFLLLALVLVHILPLSLILANYLLQPFETYTKNKYKNEAKDLLKKLNPYVIGITGSYGKTSVKAALGEILNSTLAPTFCPPKSINTEMGITREIRENLRAQHKYAVIEMGAYNVGSIQKLCNLTPPQAGIVTMVGMAHLERYGSEERIYQAKSELAKNIPADGILVCNGDNLGARKMATDFPKKTTLLYGLDKNCGPLDCFAEKIECTATHTKFKLFWKDKTYTANTKLLGAPALSNLLGVFTMACALGADPEYVLANISNIKPVDNRLAISKEGSVTFLRDAYNSNPVGFAAALDVLKDIPAKRKILMTPGMVELGEKQYEENKKAGYKAASSADIVLVVGNTNHDALVDGLSAAGFEQSNIIVCPTRTAAFSRLNEILQPDDLILIENDLVDLYEFSESF